MSRLGSGWVNPGFHSVGFCSGSSRVKFDLVISDMGLNHFWL